MNKVSRFFKKYLMVFSILGMSACAGTMRSCQAGCAESFGSDWVIGQYGINGEVIRCWELHTVSVTNEDHSDGIYWNDKSGLVHISGWYNRVQVTSGNFDSAAKSIGVDLKNCLK